MLGTDQMPDVTYESHERDVSSLSSFCCNLDGSVTGVEAWHASSMAAAVSFGSILASGGEGSIAMFTLQRYMIDLNELELWMRRLVFMGEW
jgi:hypothetical protein